MINENPVPFPEARTEPMEIKPTKTEQAEERKEGREETDNVVEPKGEYADSSTGAEEAEKIKEEEAKTNEEAQEEQIEQEGKKEDRRWNGFGDKEPEIRIHRNEYARDLKLEDNFGIEECKAKKDNLNPRENSEMERNEADDNFIKVLDSEDMSQLDKESAALTVGELELIAKEYEGIIKIAKINYLLKLEECFNAEGDDRKNKIEEFISIDHPNYLKSIARLEIRLAGINKKIEELKEKAVEKEGDNIIQDLEEKHSKAGSGEVSVKKELHLGGKFLSAGGSLLLGGIGSIYLLLKRLFGEDKMDKIMKKVTGKPVPEWAESKKQSK